MLFYYINEPKSEVPGPKSKIRILSEYPTDRAEKDVCLSRMTPTIKVFKLKVKVIKVN